MTSWGLVSTILAPTPDILRFVAYHLDRGAQRLYIYLDADTPDAYAALKDHPKVRVTTCDAAHWQRLGAARPDKHQARQTLNATHAYRRNPEVDWLIHIDVDEFLVPHAPIPDVLGAVPATRNLVRIRPMEALGGSTEAFKGFIPADGRRRQRVTQMYPNFGKHLTGGFVSHILGKIFIRTGLPDITLRIHNAFQGDVGLPDCVDLPQIDLAHFHAKTWDDWRAAYDFRLDRGSYRAELKPSHTGVSLNTLFHQIVAAHGEAGLRMFYDEAIGDSPDLRARLDAQGLLRIASLDFDTPVARHFPKAPV